MTRRTVSPRNPSYAVTVGWNPLMRTFYLHVVDAKQGKVIAHAGIAKSEICELRDLSQRLRRWADLDTETGAALLKDRDAASHAGMPA
jgi:hypothetical protein